jgi:hypothetical protein
MTDQLLRGIPNCYGLNDFNGLLDIVNDAFILSRLLIARGGCPCLPWRAALVLISIGIFDESKLKFEFTSGLTHSEDYVSLFFCLLSLSIGDFRLLRDERSIRSVNPNPKKSFRMRSWSAVSDSSSAVLVSVMPVNCRSDLFRLRGGSNVDLKEGFEIEDFCLIRCRKPSSSS